jgi:hypothetical protein
VHLGLAVSQNPGYLKLRKIRAAQNISRTVSIFNNINANLNIEDFRKNIKKIVKHRCV